MGCAADAHHFLVFAHGEARQTFIDHEHRDAFLTGLGRDQKKVRPVPIADEVFAAIQHPAVTRWASMGFDARCVRARPRLGDRNSAGACARHGGFEPAVNLRTFAMQERLIHVAKGAADQDVRSVAELFFTQDAVEVGEAAAAERLRHVQGIQTKRL